MARLGALALPFLTVWLAAAAAPEEPAGGDWLVGEAVSREFAAKTLSGTYRGGEGWRESYNADHTLSYLDSRGPMTGHWSTEGKTFCTIYNEVSTGGCYAVRRLSANCYEFTFVTYSVEEARSAPLPATDWHARGWRIEAPSTCNDSLTS